MPAGHLSSRGAYARFLSSALRRGLSLSSTAHADTIIDNFTYTYTLSGDTYTHTFSLVDGQTPDVYVALGAGTPPAPPRYSYTNIEFDNDPAILFTISFSTIFESVDAYSLKVTSYGTAFTVTPSNNPSLFDENTTSLALTTNLDLIPSTGSGLNFLSGTYFFDYGAVRLGSSTLEFSSSSLTIDQVHVASPTPSSLTSPVPEPSGLILVSTGLLSVADLARRRFLTGREDAMRTLI